jgi:hypothetical protein
MGGMTELKLPNHTYCSTRRTEESSGLENARQNEQAYFPSRTLIGLIRYGSFGGLQIQVVESMSEHALVLVRVVHNTATFQ